MSWCCFGLAIFSKVACLGLPGVFVCIDVALLKKTYENARSSYAAAIARQIPFLCLTLLGGFMAIKANEGQAVDNKLTMAEKVLWSSHSMCWYLQKTIVPTQLSLLYPFPAQGFAFENHIFLASFVTFTVFALFLMVEFLRNQIHSYPSLCFLSFLCLIFPTLGVVSSHGHFTLCADRYAYIATMPFVVLLAAGINDILHRITGAPHLAGKEDQKQDKKKNNPMGKFALVLLVCVAGCVVHYGVWSTRLLSTWQTQEGIWRHALLADPSNSMALHVSGTLKSEKGDYLAAISFHKHAFSLKDFRTERGVKWLSLSHQGFLQIGRLMQQQGNPTAGKQKI
jgi:hypothetical protein